ncbi:hypothetical protein C5E10_09240 [Pseudoclavibacter sp. RFBG4]|uniref:hypothetical protein n=1 Tax=Pseudoclavibacter sp. RFBG4 TaxID=2080575 RepID=UPI000CE7EADE|nr:hypothetical protein [Pseudoclavibacter sp. RFBG4]PPG33967.1 hypothetical protein C5E10_09240 [Pseudoclavibacter sp. RFBG4]
MSLTPEPNESHADHDERTRALAQEQAERDPLRSATHTAAVKAGLRTGAQTASTSFALFAIGAQAATWGDLGAQAVAAGIALGGALLNGTAAGIVSYLSFMSGGIPAAYRA